MTFAHRFTNSFLRLLFRIVLKIDTTELQKVPEKGPMILITNHISLLEGPLMYLFMRPRRTIALAKKETWDNPIFGKLMEWWECIPVNRGMLDREAMRLCFKVLDDGDILCIAPEGTRNPEAKLQQGKAGFSYFAMKKQVPVLPVANWGIENFTQNLKKLRRTPIGFKTGEPFILDLEEKRISGEERQAITDEMMCRLAVLLPEEHRGYYREMSRDPYKYTRTCSEKTDR